jgi:signal transduction histidine kinase
MVIGLTITLAVIGAGGWTVWRSYADTRELSNRDLRLIHLEGVVVHLDEVLTMSARMAAATGDPQWEARYNQFVPELDAAIKEMMSLAPNATMHGFSAQTDAANQALIAMETRAFELVRAGDTAGAGAILFGAEYEREKRIYAEGMKATLAAVNTEMAAAHDARGRSVKLQVAVAAFLLLVLAVAWGRAVSIARRRSRHLADALASLEQNHVRLSEAHLQLAELQREVISQERLSSLGMLAAGLAHEINNPMTYVNANIDALLEDLRDLGPDELPPQLREYADELLPATLDGIDRVTTIVRDLQRFSRGDTGKMTTYDLNHEVAAAVRMAGPKLRSGTHITVHHGTLPSVFGRAQQITQVVLNLIVNAAQAIEHEHGEIRVSTTEDGGFVVVSVRDNGCGMSRSQMDKAFEPFFTTKPVGTGTGLGLAVVHGIVKAHGGTVTIESDVGKGTCFTVRLPVAAGDVVTPAGPASGTPPAGVWVGERMTVRLPPAGGGSGSGGPGSSDGGGTGGSGSSGGSGRSRSCSKTPFA